MNGDGRVVLPPGSLSAIHRYRQPVRQRSKLRAVGRILFWIVASLAMVASSLAGGVYLFFHESVSAVRARSPDVVVAQQRLAVPLANQPAIALVVGYDRRYGERGLPSRSDTIMLLRADPQTKAVSMLSFPRDLTVPVYCRPGQPLFTGRINSAYAECGIKGTLETVKALTGLPINYLITVNFRAFKQVVSKLGGVWIDVDRRYFNNNAGLGQGYTFATIDLRPGYQRLNGSQALDFVRYRHTDNDLYRNARQQLFVKSVKEQIRSSFAVYSLPRIIGAITNNVEVGVGGKGELSGNTVLRYALFAYYLPPGHFFQERIQNLTGLNELYASPESINDAVRDFQSPDVEAPEKAAAVNFGRKLKSKRGPRPATVSVTVLNGNGVEGSANNANYLLSQRGYRMFTPPNNLPANAPSKYFRTQIYYHPTKPRAAAAARGLANLFGAADVHKGVPTPLRRLWPSTTALVVVGSTFHNTLAPSPVDRTPKRQPARVRKDLQATLGLLKPLRKRVPFKLFVPTIVERGSNPDRAQPVWTYKLKKDHQGVRIVFQTSNGLEYWGIQETDWADAPVLGDKNFRHVIKGRTYDFYYSGPHLHMVVLRAGGATYWVVNTLLNTLSNETMIAIAKGLKPLARR